MCRLSPKKFWWLKRCQRTYVWSIEHFGHIDFDIGGRKSWSVPKKVDIPEKSFFLGPNKMLIWYILPKVSNSAPTELQSSITFDLGIAEKFWDQILKAKISYFYNILPEISCPYKSYFVKIPHFGKMAPNHKNGGISGTMSHYRLHFFSRRVLMCSDP